MRPKAGRFLGVQFMWRHWRWGWQWLTPEEIASNKWPICNNLIWFTLGFIDLNYERVDQ